MTENTCSKDSYRWLFKCMDECRTYWIYHSDGIVNIRNFIRDQLKSCLLSLFLCHVQTQDPQFVLCHSILSLNFRYFIVTGNSDTDNLVSLTCGNVVPNNVQTIKWLIKKINGKTKPWTTLKYTKFTRRHE